MALHLPVLLGSCDKIFISICFAVCNKHGPAAIIELELAYMNQGAGAQKDGCRQDAIQSQLFVIRSAD